MEGEPRAWHAMRKAAAPMEHPRPAADPIRADSICADSPPAPTLRRGAAVSALPLALAGALAAFAAFPPVRGHAQLTWAFLSVAAGLAVWALGLWAAAAARGRVLALELAPPQRSHYVQSAVQLSIYAYWGWYWRNVYEAAPLIVAQLVFLYAFDGLLTWSRGRAWRLGFGPLPIVLSTNFFMWFRDDWFVFQFAMLAVAALGKEFLRWRRDGRSVHIFNPSAFGLSVCSLVLIAADATRLTWGLEVATTLARPPHIFLQVFLLGLVVQYFFSVTLMTLSAVASLVCFGWLYEQTTGVYFFVDTNIPIAIFLGMHLLITDPATAPRSNFGRVMFGAAYGLANVLLFWWLGELDIPDFYDKLLPVPLLNLCTPLLDRWARAGWPQRLGRWTEGISVRRLGFAHMALWSALFAAMWTSGYVDAPHEGAQMRFWKQAYDRGKPFAGRNLVKMVGSRADAGDAAACNQLGAIYLEGAMVERDTAAAAHWFARAAELGNARGAENVVEHFFSSGVAASKGALMYALDVLETRSARSADGRAAALLGLAYESGQGRPADRERALELFRAASALGHPIGAKGRMRMSSEQPLGGQELASVVAALERGRAHGDAESCLLLADAVRRSGSSEDARRADILLEEACRMGSQSACEALTLSRSNSDSWTSPSAR